ncbi:MAG: Uncharacterised protein [Flavobacterium sp. SCGC AAA160-P02]|nr:MAG: Uncharacterised protein [Flavobacterium sp. SCGC AAA160-P02]
MKIAIKNSDYLGVIANALCMLHCLTTPFIFISQAQASTLSSEIPFLWQSINYVFLFISLIAVYQSIRNSSNFYVRVSLFISWLFLCLFILNEGLEVYHIPEFFTFSAAILLSLLHIYNLKYCTCEEEDCCVHKNS